jgi:HD-GYP domain-containing protein (c-di-GMP phosphodiesterase class II)
MHATHLAHIVPKHTDASLPPTPQDRVFDTVTLRIDLEQILALLHADGGELVVADTATGTTLVDLICGVCPSLRPHSSLHDEHVVNTFPVMTPYTVLLPFVANETLRGTLSICRTADFAAADMSTLSALAVIVANVLRDQYQLNQEREGVYDRTLDGWIQALEMRDSETNGHTQRVTRMTVELARAWGIAEADIVHVQRGALLHDIGKLAIPDQILYKSGPLTDDEWRLMHQHPNYAYKMLSAISFLQPALAIPHYHHEKWDGSGYPFGLRGEQIPLEARLFAIVDVWDALRSDRPYRKAWSHRRARAHITRLAGSHFDPEVVDHFLHQLETQPQIFELS